MIYNLPLYFQSVKGSSPTLSGIQVLPLIVSACELFPRGAFLFRVLMPEQLCSSSSAGLFSPNFDSTKYTFSSAPALPLLVPVFSIRLRWTLVLESISASSLSLDLVMASASRFPLLLCRLSPNQKIWPCPCRPFFVCSAKP